MPQNAYDETYKDAWHMSLFIRVLLATSQFQILQLNESCLYSSLEFNIKLWTSLSLMIYDPSVQI
jgi:hypothetical protein